MTNDRDDVSYCRRQAARCRRLARDIMYQHPDVAKTLETLAQEFETRAELIAAESHPQSRDKSD
jgi:hypothetical protein